ncbi:hypothetical protein FNF29_08197 [Cafeteria roenbergensis]|uniref:Acyl-CoA dehydrogenase n=1 Tax=Cafeteria roenbergensis TaxID=33653 RepID=A0A5A8C252_CAFRO|nr:hypothetical protein FNF29_08197 [Cafeteria roenbergensis]|eukprot:KAA0146180.1 hypothetical protein FNF29_08197 [Cafeteria roenbergensis]
MLARASSAASRVRASVSGTRAFRSSAAPGLAAKAPLANPADLSPLKQFFYGRLDGPALFPFPSALSADEREAATALAEPVGKFFADKVNSAQIDWDHKIPEEVMQGLRDLGLFGLQIEERHGGLGLSNTEYARIVEELVTDPSIAVTLMAHQSIGLKGILMFGTEEQKAKYLPKLASGEHMASFCLTEPGAGSDAAGITTRAVPADDGSGDWLLSGGKMWISNGGWADVFTVFAQTPQPDGKDKMTAFVVEKAFGGITPGKPEEKLGIKASNTVTLNFDETRVPAANVLGEVGGGFKVAMGILNNGRFGLGAGTGAGMRWMATAILEHCATRKQFGRPLASFGLVKADLAFMAESAYAAEAMAYTTTALIDNGHPDASLEAAACKVFGSEAMWDVVNRCISLMGGLGFADGPDAPPFSRMMRDSRILSIFEGENRVLRLLIALQGVRGPGASLSAVAKNPLGHTSELPALVADRLYGLGLESVAASLAGSGPGASVATSSAAPALKGAAQELAALVSAHGTTVRSALTRHGKNIIEEQQQLERLANNAIDLFASAAVLSRASTAHANKSSTAEHEILIARSFAAKAATRIRARAGDIMSKPASDADTIAIADGMLKHGGYVPAHPLTL